MVAATTTSRPVATGRLVETKGPGKAPQGALIEGESEMRSNDTADTPAAPWWTHVEDLRVRDVPMAGDDLGSRRVAAEAEIDGPEDLGGEPVEVAVAQEVRVDGTPHQMPHVHLRCDGGRLDAAGAREVAAALTAAAGLLERIEGTDLS